MEGLSCKPDPIRSTRYKNGKSRRLLLPLVPQDQLDVSVACCSLPPLLSASSSPHERPRRSLAMAAPLPGFVLGPSKCRILSIDEKRAIVRELSKWPDTAPEKLHAWSRRDLLEVLCAEIGKDRKYTGTSKQKMIDYLLKVVRQKKSGGKVRDVEEAPDPPSSTPQHPPKRQRKNDQPSRLPVPANGLLVTDDSGTANSTRHCQNLACGATLNPTDVFCKSCSCCICHKYDKVKDPSLWLFCGTDSCRGGACGTSCHLECVLRDERAGVVDNGQEKRLDGSYLCVHCGKENNLLGCWKKQLMVAKDAQMVDVLCHRISLSHRLLSSTRKFKSLHKHVDTAMKKLMAETGPINGSPITVRGIVKKLSAAAEVQRLCALAVESLESMASSTSVQIQKPSLVPRRTSVRAGASSTTLCMVFSLEDVPTFSEELACLKLWHREAGIPDYSPEPTCTLLKLQRRFAVTDLNPCTEYLFKILALSENEELGTWEIAVSTKDSSKNESRGPAYRSPNTDSSCLSNHSSEDELNGNINRSINLNETPGNGFGFCGDPEGKDCLQDANLDEKPSSTNCTNSQKDSTNTSNSKLNAAKGGEVPDRTAFSDGGYENCVKAIRWLECEGHIETSFRVKFLTWFSLQATATERRIVGVYVTTLADDPTSLAAQLVDTFSEALSSRKPVAAAFGPCMKLWH